MRSINPSCKLIGLVALSFALAFIHHPILNLIIFALSIVLILASDAKPASLLIPLVPILILAGGMFFTGFRFTRGDTLTVLNTAKLHIGDGRIYNGLVFSSRVLVYAGLGLLFALTTDKIRMIRSFHQQLRVPQVFAYGILAAWGLFPQMMREYKKTRLAFRARGIKVRPWSPALLVTLLVKSTRWSEELSIAMESRGFSAKGARSTYKPERVRSRDWIYLLVTVVLIPLVGILLFR